MSEGDHFAEIQVTDEDNHATQVRAHEDNSGRGSRAASTLGAPSIKRTPSMARRSEFNDDAEREKAHLREANEKLQAKLDQQRDELRNIQEEGKANLNQTEKKTLEAIEAENDAFRVEIKALRDKLKIVCDIEQLDRLQDELAEKELQVKSLDLKKRTLSDKGRSRLRTLKTLDNDSTSSPQAVFLDLKSERKRHQKRVDKLRVELERIQESIPPVEEKVTELKQKEAAAELTDVTKEDIDELKKLDEAQLKDLEKLRRRIGALDMSYDARSKHVVWATRDLTESIAQYRAESATLEAQIAKLEQTITSNHVATKSAPPHFVTPMAPETPKASQPSSPRPPKARTSAPRPQPASQNASTEQPKSTAAPAAKAKPAPPAKAKEPTKPAKKETTAPKAAAAPAAATETTAPPAEERPPAAAADSRHSSASDRGQRLNDIDDDSQNHSGKQEYEDDYASDNDAKKKEEEPTFLTA